MSSEQARAWQSRLGRVILVNRSLDFVLIDAGTSPAPEPGTRLRAYADEEPSAELAVSVHQQRPYLIADIISGAPRVNNMVVAVKPTTATNEERRSARMEREARPPAAGPEKQPKIPTGSPAGEFTGSGGVLDLAQAPDIPQIERRPPPAPQSLIAPGRAAAEESEAIIPGLPVPRKSPSR